MASGTATSVDEYLHSVYRPDCDYVDGELIERSGGEFGHSTIQGVLIRRLFELARTLPIRVLPEMRIRIGPARLRIPDLCVMLKNQPPEPVLTRPPFLCIEILSPEDRISRVIERVKEFLEFGVAYVWVIDPENRTAFIHTRNGAHETRERLTTEDPEISIPLGDLFREFDELSKIE